MRRIDCINAKSMKSSESGSISGLYTKKMRKSTKAAEKTASLITIDFQGRSFRVRYFLPKKSEITRSNSNEIETLTYPNLSICALESNQEKYVTRSRPSILEIE